MKKLILSLAVAAIAFTACKKEEPVVVVPVAPANPIVGKWESISETQSGDVINYSKTSGGYNTVEFTSDLKLTIITSNKPETLNGNYTVSGTSLIIIPTGAPGATMQFNISGTTLILTSTSGDTATFKKM